MNIDPTYLAELSKLSFRIKRKVFGKYSGDERTKNTGDGLTFKDHKPYALGDDIRKIDWKVFARTQQMYVKRYEADRNLTLHVLLDASASMDYGSLDTNKFRHGAKLALAISYVLSKHQGRTRFATFAKNLHEARTVSGSASLGGMLNALELTRIGGETNILDSLLAYRQRTLKGKSSIVVFSDFLCPLQDIHKIFHLFPKTRIIFVTLAHPDEIELTYKGDFKVVDAESHAVARVHISPRFIEDYKKKYRQHLNDIEHSCRQAGMEFVYLNTGYPFLENFIRLWEKI